MSAFCLLAAVLFLPLSLRAAQQPPASIPAQILSAKKIFIGNGGGEDSPSFGGGQSRAYNQFYASMKAWGRYQIVTSPVDADLLLELRETLEPYDPPMAPNRGPHFRLVIRDPKTNALLWATTERVQWTTSKKNREKYFDDALARLVQMFQALAASPASTP